MEKIKVFKIADLKDLEMQVALGDITYGRMVEILNDMAYFKYSEVKKLNEPAVSKSEGIERRNLLIDFGNRVVEIQNEHQCLLQNVEKEVDKYLKSINNC